MKIKFDSIERKLWFHAKDESAKGSIMHAVENSFRLE